MINYAISFSQVSAEENSTEEAQVISINLKHITGNDIVSVLNSLIDKSVLVHEENNVLHIKGKPSKTKNILQIIKQIDNPSSPLKIEFIASNRKLDFNNQNEAQQSSNTSQSMLITERQWVTLNAGLSIPITERKRNPDGTETQSYKFKKINKSYVFKVHEFSNWSVIQVGQNNATSDNNVAEEIRNTELDTTIVGKTEEWLEVANKNDSINNSVNQLYLYVKVKKSDNATESEPKIIK